MFGLFKKKEAPKPSHSPEGYALRSFAADFLAEDLDILAVTGPMGFGAVQQEDTGLWEASIGLTAWMEEDTPEIHREEVGWSPCVTTPCGATCASGYPRTLSSNSGPGSPWTGDGCCW